MCNGVTKDLPDILHRPLGQISRASAFDPFDNRNQFGSLDLSDRARSEQRKNVRIHSPARSVYMLRALLCAPMLKPKPRNCLEKILSGNLFCGLCGLPLCHWITARSEHSASLGVAFPGKCERHIRVLSEGHKLFLAFMRIRPSPQFSLLLECSKIEAPTVAHAIWLILRHGPANLHIGQRHLYLRKSIAAESTPRSEERYPPKYPRGSWLPWYRLERKNPQNPYVY